MKVWSFILVQLEQAQRVVLLYVLDSQGSSPGRKGFCMAVSESGVFVGTIGGGMMEVKLIELAKHLLHESAHKPVIKKQYHDKKHARDQSGLICSGAQTVALLPLAGKDITLIKQIIDRNGSLDLLIDVQDGLKLLEEKSPIPSYSICIERPKTIHIFGAGHVGMALAQQMMLLDYRVLQYDDRPDMYDLQKDHIRWPLKIMDYQHLREELELHSSDVVAIVSFSYRSDKTILKQLYQMDLAYIGMMGSDHKIATLKQELIDEGIPESEIAHVFTPIGLNMYSKTAEEIAVSIAGQIILERNKGLPTGRSY